MNVQTAKKIAEREYPDMAIYSGSETEDLFIFARHPKGERDYADSCSITVNKRTGECKTEHFRQLIGKERINVFDF